MEAKEILEKYLNDKCPVCDSHKDSEDYKAHTYSGGKLMAVYFECNNCSSQYTIGLNRSRMPIESEITFYGTIQG